MNFCLVDVHYLDEYDFPNEIIDFFFKKGLMSKIMIQISFC